ncbi:MAG: NADH:ubiquinone reductase (Na(+)-transporting) subunit F [Parachlamydiaceae bacterium]
MNKNDNEWTGTVLSNENIATFIKELVVEISDGKQIHYLPGSYVLFHIPPFCTHTDKWKETIHPQYLSHWIGSQMLGQEIDLSSLPPTDCAFSIASYPAEGNILKFNVRIVPPPFVNGELAKNIPWGIGSSYIFSLRNGDTVHFSGPYGDALMIDDDRELVFLIGGAGASFARSHLLHLFRTKKTKRKVTMWYGARSLKDNVYGDELNLLMKDFPNFEYHLVISEPHKDDIQAGWPTNDPVKSNLLYLAFEQGQLKHMESPQNSLFYVCGPPLLNKSVLQILKDYGVSRENIILDDFNPTGK